MSFDAQIVRLADRQHGNVGHGQLRRFGLSEDAIRHRRRRGVLTDRFRGVYAVGPVRNDLLSRCSAAQLAAGGALTGLTAAAVYGAVKDPGGAVQLLRATSARPRNGLIVHRGDPGPTWRRHSLPLTSPARSLIEIAAREPEAIAVRVYNELQVLGLLTAEQLGTELTRMSGRKGLGLLRELTTQSGISRSALEDLLRPLLRDANLPLPAFNARVEGYEVDAVWRAERVIVELDGRRFHDTDVRFESDRARDARLAAAGYVVLRFTYRRLRRAPLAVIAELAAVLTRRSP